MVLTKIKENEKESSDEESNMIACDLKEQYVDNKQYEISARKGKGFKLFKQKF